MSCRHRAVDKIRDEDGLLIGIRCLVCGAGGTVDRPAIAAAVPAQTTMGVSCRLAIFIAIVIDIVVIAGSWSLLWWAW